MTDVVAIGRDGGVHRGSYDGYGRIGMLELDDDHSVWHRDCWLEAGSPTFDQPSDHDEDQGRLFLYEPDDEGYEQDKARYDRPPPTIPNGLHRGA